MRIAFLLFAVGLSQGIPVFSTGAVQGVVVYRADGSPAAYANVIVVGTHRGAQADSLGRFRIDRVPLGGQFVRTLLSGSEARTDTTEVISPSKPVELRIALSGQPPPPQIRIGSRTAAPDTDFVATIRPVRHFHVGEKAEFEVRIHNRGSNPALLVRSVAGSDFGGAPGVWIAIVGPLNGWTAGRQRIVIDSAPQGVQGGDFVEVQPGASFDPYEGGRIGWSLADGRFQKPGSYTATFRYITTRTSPWSWQSESCGRCDVSAELRGLLERVPALDLIAVTTFEVEP